MQYALLTCSVVTGEPFNDPMGRWRAGGGINVPLKIKVQMTSMKAKELMRTLNQLGVQNALKEAS